jgi:alpha-L-fucosidase 2
MTKRSIHLVLLGLLIVACQSESVTEKESFSLFSGPLEGRFVEHDGISIVESPNKLQREDYFVWGGNVRKGKDNKGHKLFSCEQEKNKQRLNMAAGHGLRFGELAQSWDEAIPLGNGELGALIWQKSNHLRFSLDRSDLWDLRPIESFNKPEFSYRWVAEQVLKGDYAPVQQLFDVPYNQLPGPSKIPGAALEFDVDSLGAVNNVQLKLDDAICIVEWDSGATLETFVQADFSSGWFFFKNVPEGFEPKLIPPEYQKQEKSKQVNALAGQDLQRLGYTQGKMIKDRNKMIYRQQGWGSFEYEVAVAWKDSDKNSVQGCWSISSTFSEKKSGKRAEQVVE